jgi:hypothetical protein
MKENLINIVKKKYPNYNWMEDDILDMSITSDVFNCSSLRKKLEDCDDTLFINNKINIDREVHFATDDYEFICSVYVDYKYNICCLLQFKNEK